MSAPTNHESAAGSPRRPYVKPELEEVRLVLDESVLLYCKQPAQGAPCTGPGKLDQPGAS